MTDTQQETSEGIDSPEQDARGGSAACVLVASPRDASDRSVLGGTTREGTF